MKIIAIFLSMFMTVPTYVAELDFARQRKYEKRKGKR